MIVPGTSTAVSDYPDHLKPGAEHDRDVDADSGIQHSLQVGKPTYSAAFVKGAEYMDEDRLYVISIGKDGLLPALRKLDGQLKSVRLLRKAESKWLILH